MVLNEFADLTEEEFKNGHHQPTRLSDESVPTEDRIREAYFQWCHYYEKTYDEKRLRTFAANFIVVEKYHMQTQENLVLNEYADLTEKEYRKHLETAAHFAIPENVGPRATNQDTTTTYLPEPKPMMSKPIDDPITSYLDPEPIPTAPRMEELKPPIPKAQVEIVQSSSSSNSIITPAPPLETAEDSRSTNEIIAALQRTVDSLTKMVQSLAARPAPEPKPAEPLDSLVIDVLEQQGQSISQLEQSVEGLHGIQKQGSELMELVSGNQRQMTEFMEDVQSELGILQEEQQVVEDNYAVMLQRIEDLEATVAKFDKNDPILNESLVLSPSKGVRRVQLQPNLPPIGYRPPQIQP